MRSYVGAFILAMALAAVLTPVARRLAFRVGAISMPGGRNVNVNVIPRLGGVAIAVAFSAPILVLFMLDAGVAASLRQNATMVAGALAGAGALCVLGVWDDARGLPAMTKFAVQLLVAGLAFALGFRIEAVSLPWLGHLQMGIFALPITVIWIVGITNAVNLIDGLDGLAAGVAFFAAVTNFVVAYLSDSIVVALFMASMMGALVGFLFYNFNPARIFMGDSGSYFIGFTLATISLAGSSQKASTTVALLVPMVALGVPIFDTLFSMLRRVVERRSMFSPDQGHIHHRLLELGLTHRRAVLTLYSFCMVLTVAAIAISLGRRWTVGVAMLSASAVIIVLMRLSSQYPGAWSVRRRGVHLYDDVTERLRERLSDSLRAIGEAKSEQDLWRALTQLSQGSGVCGWTLSRRDGAYQEKWTTPEAQDAVVSAEYPVGAGDSSVSTLTLQFESSSHVHGLSPHAEVLLQLVADQLSRRLTELGSPLVSAEPPKEQTLGTEQEVPADSVAPLKLKGADL